MQNRRWLVVLFFVLSACTKERVNNSHSYLELYVEGEEESKKWELVSGVWNDSTGKMAIEANGYYFGTCRIIVENVKTAGTVLQAKLTNFYYTDGIDLRPTDVNGTLVFTEVNHKVIRGTFNVYLENNYNGASGRKVKGEFGVIRKYE